jgi:AraC-like DNA-binding protein
MTYLAEWRLTLAADLLLSSDDTVEAVGRSVGYDNPFAFSSAFKRLHHVSPRAFRLQPQEERRSAGGTAATPATP